MRSTRGFESTALDQHLLEVEDDVRHVLDDVGDGGELVERALDPHRVIAAPCSDDSRMRRRLLPRVMPKPRSSGSQVNLP